MASGDAAEPCSACPGSKTHTTSRTHYRIRASNLRRARITPPQMHASSWKRGPSRAA